MGGSQTLRNEYPWQAALLDYRKGGNPVPFCGGSIINGWFILTAAHCLKLMEDKDMRVAVGKHETASNYGVSLNREKQLFVGP